MCQNPFKSYNPIDKVKQSYVKLKKETTNKLRTPIEKKWKNIDGGFNKTWKVFMNILHAVSK